MKKHGPFLPAMPTDQVPLLSVRPQKQPAVLHGCSLLSPGTCLFPKMCHHHPASGAARCLSNQPPATRIMFGITKSGPQLSQQPFHPLLNKTHQILTQSREDLYPFSFAVPPHCIAGNGLYSSLNAFIISLYPQMCSFYSSLLFLVFISSSHLHPWSIYSQKNQSLPALLPPSTLT